MKNKKFAFLLLFFICCGCSVSYRIEIEDNNINEKISIIEYNNVDWDAEYKIIENVDDDYLNKTTYREYVNQKFYENESALKNGVNSETFYSKKIISTKDKLGLEYLYTFDINQYKDSAAASICFRYFNFLTAESKYILSTNNVVKCFDDYKKLESLTIELSTNHKVVKHNADAVNGYTYYWNIDRTNYSDKSIYIELYKDKYEKGYNNEKNKRQLAKVIKTILIVVLCIAISLFIVIIILRKKANRNNKI